MTNITPIRRPAINPPMNSSARLVAAVLRCRNCSAEWRSVLDEWCSVPADNLRCPRCVVVPTDPTEAA